MLLRLALLLSLSLLVACGSEEEDFGALPAEQDRTITDMPAEKRKLVAPTNLFAAIINNRPEEVRKLLDANPIELFTPNGEGDTPLEVAIKYGFPEIAEIFLGRMTAEDLKQVNKSGESYLFQAARVGSPALVTRLGDIYFNSVYVDFEVSDIDAPNAKGETALFAAADAPTARALHNQYHRTFLELAGYDFMLHADNKSQTFLHAAARDGRKDVILWAAHEICDKGSAEKIESYYVGDVVSGLIYAGRWLQTHVADFGTPFSLLFNQVNDDGQTALHVALEHRRWQTVRALASCRWLDYDERDAQQDLPVQTFLKSLNPARAPIEQDAKDAFAFLIKQESSLCRYWCSTTDKANNVNIQGDTALHLAARLADPYFYQQLAKFGDVNARDANGQRAADLYDRQRKVNSSYGN